MQQITADIKALFSKYNDAPITKLDKMPQAGSDRQYFRIHSNDRTFIATYGTNIKENETFIYFSEQFARLKLATPAVLYVSDDHRIYIQNDVGSISLLDKLEQDGLTEKCMACIKKAFPNWLSCRCPVTK